MWWNCILEYYYNFVYREYKLFLLSHIKSEKKNTKQTHNETQNLQIQNSNYQHFIITEKYRIKKRVWNMTSPSRFSLLTCNNSDKTDSRQKDNPVKQRDFSVAWPMSCQTCHVKLVLCSKTNSSRGFAFVTGPEYICNYVSN